MQPAMPFDRPAATNPKRRKAWPHAQSEHGRKQDHRHVPLTAWRAIGSAPCAIWRVGEHEKQQKKTHKPPPTAAGRSSRRRRKVGWMTSKSCEIKPKAQALSLGGPTFFVSGTNRPAIA